MSTTAAVPDQAAVPSGASEELAGPPHVDPFLATRPVEASERVSSVDVIRGFSLMGILLMNITAFSGPFWNYMFPLTTVKPVFNGPHWRINTVAWFLRWVLAEGKMRALFSMLFGAGVVLLTGRAESRGAGVRTADIFTRRNMWLALFGMLHCYLIWNGDILFFYGITALIFLFPFRHLKPKNLLWAAAIVLLLNSVVANGGRYFAAMHTYKTAQQANAALAAHKPLTDDQKDALKSWHDIQNDFRPDTKKLYKDIAAHQRGYFSALAADAPDGFRGETFGLYFGFGDWLGMMLLGMALFKNGFLSAKLSGRTYAVVALLGLGISWPVVFFGALHAWRSHFDLFATMRGMLFTYDLGRIAGALGSAAVLLLMVKANILRWLLARIAAVGQMAFSNYILTSLTMRFLFVWGPLHWYGYMEYYKLYIVVACMWTVNLAFSALWLRAFRFGPLEWCWRSLTYWQRQPMRLAAPQPLPVQTASAAA
jgi:uncharacterized protein